MGEIELIHLGPALETSTGRVLEQVLRRELRLLGPIRTIAVPAELASTDPVPPPAWVTSALRAMRQSAAVQELFVCLTFPSRRPGIPEFELTRSLLVTGIVGPTMTRARMDLGDRWRLRIQREPCEHPQSGQVDRKESPP